MTKKKLIIYWCIVVILACLVAIIETNNIQPIKQETKQEHEVQQEQERIGIPEDVKPDLPDLEKKKGRENEAPYKRMTWDEYMEEQHDHIGEGEE